VGPLEGFWAQSGLSKYIFGPKVGRTGQAITGCPHARHQFEDTTLERDGHEVVSSNLRFHPG
jgi:hypothetical protein